MQSEKIRFAVLLAFGLACLVQAVGQPSGSQPRIVNIVNFIRDIEPRDSAITRDVLYQTVVQQIRLMKQYHLGGTFLLQYDALIDKRYQDLLKALPANEFEIGAWWELPQPLIEKAGIKWRGEYAWDWHSNVGFSVGYTPAEREKIIDVYFADFKNIFGYYPKTVASWVIDAHSLAYLYDKYKIVASANCKDQVGTDGFTLWGGYWSGAYYPSRLNAYMPAQHAGKQIPVPVFRMLGSDPIRQYANGSDVVTLEPVYSFGGGNKDWVDWYFRSFSTDPVLGYTYTQAGQENSFTWSAMQKGLETQFPLIARLRQQGKVRVQTLSQTGEWFTKKYPVTPATATTVTKDTGNGNQKTIWYNSRYYRLNILWEDSNLNIRDIHLFNERVPDKYLTGVTTVNQSFFYTLPLVDGFNWGKPGQTAGFRLMMKKDGKEIPVKGGNPIFTNSGNSSIHISWATDIGTFEMDCRDSSFAIKSRPQPGVEWFLVLFVKEGAQTPVQGTSAKFVSYSFDGHAYQLTTSPGQIQKGNQDALYRIEPQKGMIQLHLADDGGK